MKTIVLLFSCVFFVQCSSDRTISPLTEKEDLIFQEFDKMDERNKVFITDKNEPGEPLILCLTFVDKDTGQALSNQKVSFYHTSNEGEYEPSNLNDETTARLNGTAISDTSGRVYVKTILPGDYGSSENNRHIHTTVYGARPENYDIFFKQFSGGMGSLMNAGNDQMFYTQLKRTANNELICFLTIEAKDPKSN
jgi:hypothetical protein